MIKRLYAFGLASLLLVVTVAPVTAAAPTVTKYTFHDVVMADNTVTEVEATVKDANKNSYTTCGYYSDDYVEYLGSYSEPIVAGTTAEEVQNFCTAHYADRVL